MGLLPGDFLCVKCLFSLEFNSPSGGNFLECEHENIVEHSTDSTHLPSDHFIRTYAKPVFQHRLLMHSILCNTCIREDLTTANVNIQHLFAGE